MIPEIRRYDAILPIEVYVGDVHSRTALILINAENAFVEDAGETFELRPDGTDLRGEFLH